MIEYTDILKEKNQRTAHGFSPVYLLLCALCVLCGEVLSAPNPE
jgi:hypothetical protein